MPAEVLELVLEHDGHDWQVHGKNLFAHAASLAELDRALIRALSANGDLTGSITVNMRFNRASLPGWTRQYMPHYFNRTITLTPGNGAVSA